MYLGACYSLAELSDLVARLDVGKSCSNSSRDHQTGLANLLGFLLEGGQHFLGDAKEQGSAWALGASQGSSGPSCAEHRGVCS